MEYASAAQTDAAAENGNRRPLRRRLGLGISIGMVTAAICSVAFITFHRNIGAAAKVESLRKPFRLYDSSCKGCREMPDSSAKYEGWPDERPVEVITDDNGIVNVFAIGDWGATLPGHATFAGGCCDQHAQFSVAGAVKSRAEWANPQYVLNVGDNFYVEGLKGTNCQQPPGANPGSTMNDFHQGWETMYGSVTQKPWIGVLGNHDYGGWRMDRGWPQQIGYSFMNYNWIMPARYFTKRMKHKGFDIDYFMIDTNAFDAKGWNEEPDHNMCSPHNIGGTGSCGANGGMPNIQACKDWFWSTYAVQKNWLEEKMEASDARWKIVVTHFPCGYDVDYWKKLKAKYGLDLLVTGHRHQQELWDPATSSHYLQSFMKSTKWDTAAPACFVSGGGGGIISQKFKYADYGSDLQWYGFFHLTIHKDWMKMELVGTNGKVMGNMTIHPHGTKAAKQQEAERSKYFQTYHYTLCDMSYCGDMNNPWKKVCEWGYAPMQTCAGCYPCKGMCESFCGDKNNPPEKVCGWSGKKPWVSCKACDMCKQTPPKPQNETEILMKK